MSEARRSPQIVVARISDLDARSRAAETLAAYVRADQTRTFRQVLWRRLALAAAGWSLLGLLHVIPVIGVVIGSSLFAVIAAGAAVLEHRAGRRSLDLVAAARRHSDG